MLRFFFSAIARWFEAVEAANQELFERDPEMWSYLQSEVFDEW